MPEKTHASVLGFYAGIFRYYDAANAFLTLGLDGRWRRTAARAALLSGPERVLDVCCGTGALAAEIRRLSHGTALVTGLDFSEEMLSEARKKYPEIHFLKGEAGRLPFPDASFDALTLSFATRNLAFGKTPLTDHFSEFRRVLKPGAIFVHLETSQPANRFIRRLFHLYVGAMVSAVKFIAPRGRTAYGFLAGTIASFHEPEELSKLILEAGFPEVTHRPLVFGAIALHTAVKGKE